MARAYNIEKWVPGKTKFTCPAKVEGEASITRLFIGQDPQTRALRFQTWSETKERGVGRPLVLAEVPGDWKLA